MKIGVISDTHLNIPDDRLEKIVEDYFHDVDLILHAGDMVELDVLDVFRDKKVYAVSGNMDHDSVREVFPGKRILEIEGRRIGLIHGWGSPFGLEEKIMREFENVECIVYGHTHRAMNEVRDGILLFNPGSPTDQRFAKHNSVGILDIGKEIVGKIIDLDDSVDL
ncbi:MAG: metallophosphoesterase family protein [Deltaproteobacteria bacterium]|nr:metallophosphoesterase family protein [Deltaproteobacteria bacterium]MBW2594768.1 metallophosphoesterase family protein [Deltaproteobacteria bacterium]MBW2649692.1 metallophosphoesterase family protein [Deltaproteobacteria bacterium]